jgi:putative flippase GtrA
MTPTFLRRAFDETRFRFLLIGVWNTLFGYGIFWLLYAVTSRLFSARYLAYTTAQVVGWIIAVANAYFLHKHVTFRSRARGRAAVFEFLRFMQTYLAMFVLGLGLLPFLVEIAGLEPRVAALIATAIGVVVSYLGHRFVTFRRDEAPKS